jgi:hypothetical protein
MYSANRIDLRTAKTEHLEDDEVYKFFVPPEKDMNVITMIKSTYIVGHKGSGKSIILRYLSSPLQQSRRKKNDLIDFDKKAIGIFMRCDAGRFAGLTEMDSDHLDIKWIRHFTHTLNLYALNGLLEFLSSVFLDNQFAITKKEMNSFLKGIFKLLRIRVKTLNLENTFKIIEEEIDRLQEEYQENKLGAGKRFYTDHRFLFETRKILRESFSGLQRMEPVFLLDEYNELSNGQQRVINDMIKLRHPVFKMSSLPYGYIRTRTRGQENDIDQDFDVVYLANKALLPNSKEFQPTKDFFSKVWDKRIESFPSIKKKIDNILENPRSLQISQTKKQTKADVRKTNELNYCGFSNYVLLSAGNPKTFLDLLQSTIDKAYEAQIDLTIDSIPTKLQLESVQEFSNERRNDIITSHSDYGKNLHRLIESIGKNLKTKCVNSKSNYRLVSVKDGEKLSDLSYETIKLGLQKAWLIQSDSGRISRSEKIRLHTFTLNNILIPSFELPLASQQTWEVDAKYLDDIIVGKEDKIEIITESTDNPLKTETLQKTNDRKSPFGLEVYSDLNVIKKLLKDDQIVIFIGAGLSTYAGLPSANTLKEKICDDLQIDPDQVDHLYDAVELFLNRRKEPDLYALIKKELKVKNVNLNLHRKIARFGITKIITTNWDNLLEESFGLERKDCEVIVDPAELKIYDEKQIGIFKMHGDFAHQDAIIITKSQYQKYPSTHGYMLTHIQSYLQNKGMLFIGYSLNDINFNQIRSNVIEQMGSLRTSYAIVNEIDESQRVFLEKVGIKVIKSDFVPIIEHLCES